MIRILGFVMLITACTLCGCSASASLKRHTSLLESAVSMLEYISELLRYSRANVSDIKKKLTGSKYSIFLSEDIRIYLDNDETAALNEFFSSLGQSDLEGQQAMILQYLAFFRSKADEARDKEKRLCKLYSSLGFISGAFLTVILI